MAKTKTDAKTLELIQAVKRQKEDIAKAERPNWATNCSFSYNENGGNAVNLHVESNIRNLICIASFLRDKANSYKETAAELGVEAPDFTWQGFSVKDWLEDVKLRINKVQIASKKKKLEALEERLNKIISPELRAEMELEAIQNELK